MKGFFRFGQRFIESSFKNGKALGLASLVCAERIHHHYTTVNAYNSTPFDAKLEQQYHRSIS